MSNEQGFLAHLGELRTRLMRVLLTLALATVGMLPWSQDLFSFVAMPLLSVLPLDGQMIATQVTTPLLAPIKLAFITAAFVVVPYLLWELWAFISPGLYQSEQRIALPLLMSSVLMFYSGVAICWLVLLPLLLNVFVSFSPEGVTMMTDIAQWLNFLLPLLFIFGMIFQIPVGMVLLARTTAVSAATYVRGRRIALILSFVVGMLLTPPDPVSQILLAVPMYMLWEAGIVVSRLVEKDADKPETADGGDGETRTPTS